MSKTKFELEMQWAAFFEALDVPSVRHERIIGGIAEPSSDPQRNTYVPSFYLPEHDAFFDVIERWSPEAAAPIFAAANATNIPLFVFAGELPTTDPERPGAILLEVSLDGSNRGVRKSPNHWWSECNVCGRVWLCQRGEVWQICECHEVGSAVTGHRAERIMNAYKAAAEAGRPTN